MIPRPALTGRRVWAARLVAVAADGLQIVLLPFFGVGFLSPAMDVMDVVVAVLLTALVGFHWSFLPTFLAELIPGLGLIPTWTMAAFLATRKRA
jgi:hypothetical protein